MIELVLFTLYWLALLPVLLVQNFPWSLMEPAWSWDHRHTFFPWLLCSLHSLCVPPKSIPSTHHSFQNLSGPSSSRDPNLARRPFLLTWEKMFMLCALLGHSSRNICFLQVMCYLTAWWVRMDLRCHWPPGTLWLAMQGLLWVQAGGHAGPGGRRVIISTSVHSNHTSFCQTKQYFQSYCRVCLPLGSETNQHDVAWW